MLNLNKKQLTYVSKKVFKFYLTDPTNLKEKFLRTRVRNYLGKFELEGLDLKKIKLTLKNLESSNESINFYKEKSINKYSRYLKNGKYIVSYDLFENESQEVIFRLISDILVKVSKKYYSPRGKDVVNLISKIQSKGFKRLTLGGCIVEKVYDLLIFRKEFEF